MKKISRIGLLLLLLVFLCSLSLFGQSGRKSTDLSSPRSTVYNHLHFLQEASSEPEKAARSLDNPNLDYSSEELERRAVKLKEIFDGYGFYINFQDIPNDKNYSDSTGQKFEYKLFERDDFKVLIEKVNNKWYYSATTVRAVSEAHDKLYFFNLDGVLGFDFQNGDNIFLGLTTGQWISILLLLAAGALSYNFMRWLLRTLTNRVSKRFGIEDIESHYVRPITRPLAMLMIFTLGRAFLPMLYLPIGVTRYVQPAFKIILPVFVAVIVYNLVNLLVYILESVADKRNRQVDKQILPFIRKSLKLLVVVLGLFFILQNVGFNVTGLIAGLSIGGLALALAAQDTLKHFFGSIMIFADKPFKIGDWIVGSGIDGMVEEVGFRSTRIRTFYDSLTYIPNGKIADMTIDNLGVRKHRRYMTFLRLPFGTSKTQIESFVDGLKKIIEDHPETRKDVYFVSLYSITDYGIEILFYTFFSVPEYGDEMRCRQQVNLQIMSLAEELEIKFAYPTKRVFSSGSDEVPDPLSGRRDIGSPDDDRHPR